MAQPAWTFSRDADRLTISREADEEGVRLTVSSNGTFRSYFLPNLIRLETFQHDMETMLLKTGWAFEYYSPDRRTGRDRRGWPRRNNDRRRWWTDGENKPAGVDEWEPFADV